MLKTNVKASAITNLTDARYFAAWAVKWMGFSMEVGSENFLPPTKIKAMKEWVDGVEIVGEFGMTTEEEVRSAVDLIGLDAIQLGMFTDMEVLASLKDLTVIKELVIDKSSELTIIENDLIKCGPYCDYFLLNFDKNNFTWPTLDNDLPSIKDSLIEWVKTYKIILSIDLLPSEVESVLQGLNPFGLNLKGGEEEKVGFKSFDELDELFEVLEILV